MSWTVSKNLVGEQPESEPISVDTFPQALAKLDRLVYEDVTAAVDGAPPAHLAAINRADQAFTDTFLAACDREVEPQEISFCVLDHVYFAKKVD